VFFDRSVVFSGSTNKTDTHDITEILLKDCLTPSNKQTNNNICSKENKRPCNKGYLLVLNNKHTHTRGVVV